MYVYMLNASKFIYVNIRLQELNFLRKQNKEETWPYLDPLYKWPLN